MQKDERDLLDVLKSELEFLEKGGYGHSPTMPWRPHYIFEDSPTCANYDSRESPGRCIDCVLTHFVPPGRRSAKNPCRHIPLNASGETLDSLYRYGDQNETEDTVGRCLRTTIQRLEEERMAVKQAHTKHALQGTPLYRKQHPKCANPACPTNFHWTGGGKFFRFRADPVSATVDNSTGDAPRGTHGVTHYWLCERCSHVFTLADEEGNVLIKLLWPEFAAGQTQKKESFGF
jgi:hypothetical protein